MKIYMVELRDYDHSQSVGYFIEPEKAKLCCDYLNKAKPSGYEGFEWAVSAYELDTTNYEVLHKDFEDSEKIKREEEILHNEREERELFERLKAKYG